MLIENESYSSKIGFSLIFVVLHLTSRGWCVLLKVFFLHLDNGMCSALGVILCFDGQDWKQLVCDYGALFGAFWPCPKAMNLPFLEIIRAIWCVKLISDIRIKKNI
jgi:hypothetical protein